MKSMVVILVGLSVALSGGLALAEEPTKEAVAKVPAKVPAKAPASPPATAGEGLSVTRMEVATGVENREPQGTATAFPSTQDKVYCYVELKDVPEGATITYVWSYGGKQVSKSTQTLKRAAKWRTWAKRALSGKKGEWKVDLQDASGAVLKSAAFKVE